MNLTRITALTLISSLSLAFGCSTGNNLVAPSNTVINSSSVDTDTSFFNSARHVTTDDSELRGSKQTSVLSLNKLSSETVFKNSAGSSTLTFKTVQVKKGLTNISVKDAEKITVSGTINYPDDKNRLKAGANVSVSLQSNGKSAGTTLTDEKGVWSLSLDKSQFSGKSLNVVFQFSNKYWTIGGKQQSYQWQGPQIDNLSTDVDTGVIAPVSGTENAKAAFINDIYNRYLQFFKKQGIDVNPWWKKQVKTIWPGDSNYYSWGTVNLTDADHWDVNGHEIGHAMTDIGTNSEMGGGQHKIDECYSEALAWSEGFATFLSGAISLDSNDEDAKFEFLVMRRAPIRMENVPDDVCKGQKNEWRVSATMWDLYDIHADGGDSVQVPFKTLWASLSRKDKKIGSMKDAADSLKEIAPKELTAAIDASLKFNTMF